MAAHIESLEISTYRGIRDLRIEDLGDVNIFVGDNNTGKTSVLEAIQLLCAPNKFNLVQISRQREKYRRVGISFVDSVKYLFDIRESSQEHYELSVGGSIHGDKGIVHVSGDVETQLIDLHELASKQYISKYQVGEDAEEVDTFFGRIESSFQEHGQLSFLEKSSDSFEINNFTRLRASTNKDYVILQSRAILTVDHVVENAFNVLIKDSRVKDKAVKLLREEFDSDIVDLRIIGDDNGSRYIPVVEVESGEYIPLSLYGDGMKKALTMLNAIVNTENGVVLIDEFETALHTSAMETVFSFITEAARKSGVQLFLTTHSAEALDKILESSGNNIQNTRVIRLKKKNGKTYSRVMNGAEALENRKDYDLELRV